MENESSAQDLYRLAFFNTPSENRFTYRTDSEARFTISPGGTVTEGPFQFVEFTTFEDLRDDVVGQWFLVDHDLNVGSFEVTAFAESDIPDVGIVTPPDGERVMSGTTVPVVYSATPSPDFLFWTFNFNNEEISIAPFFGGIAGFLEPGVLESSVRLQGSAQINNAGFVTSIDDNQLTFDIASTATIVGNSPETEVIFFVNSIVGDVNRDGVVSLLDIQPLVDLIAAGEYQFEADINGDGSVTLLDINAFQDLLGSQP
ncbi:MAG: dockerin type I repeat-containing protein [Planctomycetota bacterium]